MTILWSLLTIQLAIHSLLLEKVKFDYSLVAKILIFQFVNFDYFFVKNDYLNSEKRTRWIVIEKMTYFWLRYQTDIGTRKY